MRRKGAAARDALITCRTFTSPTRPLLNTNAVVFITAMSATSTRMHSGRRCCCCSYCSCRGYCGSGCRQRASCSRRREVMPPWHCRRRTSRRREVMPPWYCRGRFLRQPPWSRRWSRRPPSWLWPTPRLLLLIFDLRFQRKCCFPIVHLQGGL